jgi:aryl-alcohol dehydrogenase-like predicted oxidoreductase
LVSHHLCTGKRELGPWCLGTAQLGFEYGIANAHGLPSFEQARQIVSTAWNAGIVLFDTAAAYGSSQQVLGKCFESLGIQSKPLVVTKLSETDLLSDRCEQLIVASLKLCRVPRFFGLLSHSPIALHNIEKVQAVFESLKAKGLVEFCGASVYEAADGKFALGLKHFDLVQLPINALDRTAVDEGIIEEARRTSKLLFFRSALLQGLLTLRPEQLPNRISFATEILSEWTEVCQRANLPPHQLALHIANRLAGGYPLVIGAELGAQVEENLRILCNEPKNLAEVIAETTKLAQKATAILRNPNLWPREDVLTR